MNLLFLYERALYYSSIAYGEYSKVGQYFRDTLLIVAVLGTRNIKPTKWQIGLAFVSIIFISVIAGIILVRLGVPQYNATLGNNNNPQMQQLLQQNQEILNKLKSYPPIVK